MSGWMRYPGQLAHFAGDISRPLERVVDGEREGIGVGWHTSCNRELLIFHVDARPSAAWVDALELRQALAEGTRLFCLRCAYWAAQDALVLDHRSLSRFVEDIASGAVPGLTWPSGLR